MDTYQMPGFWERAFRALTYLFTAFIGFSVLIWPPFDSVTNALGAGLAEVWAIFILVSLLAAPAAMMGKYLVEYALIPFFTTALIVALYVVWVRATNDYTIIPRVSVSTALVCGFTARFVHLHRIVTVVKKAKLGDVPWTPSS